LVYYFVSASASTTVVNGSLPKKSLKLLCLSKLSCR
jgi:hypothetical protein